MRIMTILGSPRRHGNTAKVLGWIEERFRAGAHDVDRAVVVDYSVRGCGECFACKRGGAELCQIDDEANGLYRRMVAADLVLVAAPVFCWGFPAQLKGLLDRMYCLMDNEGAHPAPPWRPGKAMALLLTGAGEETNNGDLVIRAFENLLQWIQARPAGSWFVGGCTDPESIGDEVQKQAQEFAVKLGRECC